MINVFDLIWHFVEGDMDPKQFVDVINKNPEILKWLQMCIPKDKKFYKCYIQNNAYGQNAHRIEEVPYDIKLAVDRCAEQSHNNPWCFYYYLHLELIELLKEIYPKYNFKAREDIKERYFFELEAIPRYIGGIEIYESGIIDEIINNLPNEATNDEKIKICQKEITSRFHLSDNRYPCWRKESEWPMGQNKNPMKFVSQENVDGNTYIYTFEDTETKETRKITQSSNM